MSMVSNCLWMAEPSSTEEVLDSVRLVAGVFGRHAPAPLAFSPRRCHNPPPFRVRPGSHEEDDGQDQSENARRRAGRR